MIKNMQGFYNFQVFSTTSTTCKHVKHGKVNHFDIWKFYIYTS